MGGGREESQLGKKVRNRKNTPMGRGREASRLGKKVRNRENTPMGRVREASWLGKITVKQEITPIGSRQRKRKYGLRNKSLCDTIGKKQKQTRKQPRYI